MSSRLLVLRRSQRLLHHAASRSLPIAASASLVGYHHRNAFSTCAAPSPPPMAAHERPLALATSTKVSSKSLLERLREWCRKAYETFVLGVRASELLVRLSPLALLTPLAMLAHPHTTAMSDAAWWYTVHTMQALGPVAVKLCQWAATRRDLFPPQICDRLSVLHDSGFAHSWRHTDRTLKEAFGKDYRKKGLVVEDPTRDVIGSGSAGQVYKGFILEDEGKRVRPVAIKVLHPKFQFKVERDLKCIETLASILHSLPIERVHVANLPRAVDTFSTSLRKQSDLRNEARNLKRFRANFYGSNGESDIGSSVFFPQPVEGWVTTEVLVEDLVADAKPIATYLHDDSDAGRVVRRELAGPLLRAFLKMVFWDNFVHGDLHPGNVLVRSTWVKNEPAFYTKVWPFSLFFNNESDDAEDRVLQRSIVFLDAGIADSLSTNDQKNLVDLFRAVLLNDGARAGRLMVERAKHERCTQTPGGKEAFAAGVDAIVAEFHDARRQKGLTLGAVRIGQLLSRVLDLCRAHGVEIDPAMAGVVLSTLVLEGLGRSLEPDLNLFDFARPFVLGMGRV